MGISFMSYGKTADDMIWRFIRIGVGAAGSDFSLTLSPAMFNLGKILPLVSNLWITPVVGYIVTADELFGGLGFSVVF